MTNLIYGFLIIFWLLIIGGGGISIGAIHFIDILVEDSVNDILVLVIKGVVIIIIILGWITILQKTTNKILRDKIKFT